MTKKSLIVLICLIVYSIVPANAADDLDLDVDVNTAYQSAYNDCAENTTGEDETTVDAEIEQCMKDKGYSTDVTPIFIDNDSYITDEDSDNEDYSDEE